MCVYTYFEDIDGVYNTYVFRCDENGKGLGQLNLESYTTYEDDESKFCHTEVVKKWRGEEYDHEIDELR